MSFLKPAISSPQKFHFLLAFILCCIPLFINFSVQRYFSCDGVYYFTSLVDNGQFLDFAWSRNHAIYLTQFPIVIAQFMGISDLGWLEFFFAVGLLLPILLSFLLCLLIVEKEKNHLLILPLFSLLSITCIGDGIITGEHHVLTTVCWPIVFLLLQKKDYSWKSASLLILLMALHMRTYESTVATGTLFTLGCIIKLYFSTSPTQKSILTIALLLAFGSVTVAALATLYPRDPLNRSGFFSAMTLSIINLRFLCCISFILPFLFAIILKKKNIALIGLALSILFYIAFFFSGHQLDLNLSFGSRVITVYYLPLLIIAAPALYYTTEKLDKSHYFQMSIFTAITIFSHSYLIRHWIDYRTTFHQVLASNSGYLAIENTPLNNHSQSWGWTSPLLSYLWSDNTKITTLILNPKKNNWQPFEPKKEHVLPNYKIPISIK